MTPEMINACIGAGAVFVAAIVWFTRLESLVRFREKECTSKNELQNEKLKEMKSQFDKEIAELKLSHSSTKDQIWAKMDEINKNMTEVLRSLSKIQGSIEAGAKHESHS